MARELALVVSTASDVGTVIELARAARQRCVEVGIFFMSDAVAALVRERARLAALAEDGCELVACAKSAHDRKLGEAELGMLLGSQDDHAALVHRADRVVAFT